MAATVTNTEALGNKISELQTLHVHGQIRPIRQ